MNLFGNYSSNQYSISFSTNNDEPYHAQVIDPVLHLKTVYHFMTVQIASNEYLIGESLQKRINKYLVQVGVSYRELNSMIQVQSNNGIKMVSLMATQTLPQEWFHIFYEEKQGEEL